MIHALWIACREESGELAEVRRNFRTACLPTSVSGFVSDLPRLAEAVFAPWIAVGRNLRACGVQRAGVYALVSGARGRAASASTGSRGSSSRPTPFVTRP